MTTIVTATLAWVGWNIVAPLLFGAMIGLGCALFWLPGAIRRATCAHLRFYEPTVGPQACHGVCRDCGKDLGFIDDVRALRGRKEG